MSSENTENLKNVFIEKMKEHNFDFNELHNIFKKVTNENDKIEILYKSIDTMICKKNINNKFITFLNELNNNELYITLFNKIILNLEDILLDSPCAKNNLLSIINNLSVLDKDNKLEISNKINSILKSDDEEDNY